MASPCWKGQGVTSRSQQLLGIQGELLLCYVRWIASFQLDSESRNVTLRGVLVRCTTAWAALAQRIWGWIMHGSSGDQFCRLLHLPLCLNGPGHPSPWGCARCTGLENVQSSLQDFQSCRLKMFGPVGSQGLSVWSSFSEKCDSLHLFFIFKRHSYVEARCGMQTWISLTLRVFSLAM